MKSSKHNIPEINAGSMADIAFLLLIFFLVTAMIPNDKGIFRKLPELCPPNQNCEIEFKERNVLEIHINAKQELLVESKLTSIENLKDLVKDFIDNNGSGTCSYCNGIGIQNASEHPEKAVVSIKNDPTIPYGFYVGIQDEISKAYSELREKYAYQKFDKPVKELSKTELGDVKKAYPMIISEADSN